MNGRLGIVGGLSILGTTGIVVPYSCSAWIHSIHSGIDVARAAGLTHIAGATGSASEAAVQKLHDLPEIALIDMGDFVGGMLKYVRKHPVPRVTIAGGIGKMTKLAQGLLDLHSRRGAVDLGVLADARRARPAARASLPSASSPPTPPPKPSLMPRPMAWRSATRWRAPAGTRAAAVVAGKPVAGEPIEIEIAVFDRDGRLVGHAPFRAAHAAPPRKRRR